MEYKTLGLKISDFLNPLIVWFLSIPKKVYKFVAPNGKINKKRIAALVCCVVFAVSAIVSALGFAVYQCVKNGQDDEIVEELDDEGDDVHGDRFGVSDSDSLKDFLMKWAKTGSPVSSDNVINILLIGDDGRNGQQARSDTMIIASLNKITKKISLVSVPRDSFVYMEVEGKGEGFGFDKLNHAYKFGHSSPSGGGDTLVKNIENNLKIRIDHWASANFSSFEKIIDILNGVNLTVSEAEAYEVNSNPKTYRNATLPSGENVLLNGKQALAYSRIRNIGSDSQRTSRQRTVISKIMEKAKDATLIQITQIVGSVYKNINTDMSLQEITTLAIEALNNGWANYAMESIEFPQNTDLRRPAYMTGTWAEPYKNISLWIIDYPRAARDLQLLLYGETKIDITKDTPSAIDFLSPPVQTYTTNNNASSGSGNSGQTTTTTTAVSSGNKTDKKDSEEKTTETNKKETTTKAPKKDSVTTTETTIVTTTKKASETETTVTTTEVPKTSGDSNGSPAGTDPANNANPVDAEPADGE